MSRGLPDLRIGLTGGLGTGKSTVAALFEKLGAAVNDADTLVHRRLRRGDPVYSGVVAEFGPGILDRDGEIDRRRLAGEVFGKPDRLERLNEIVHPPVVKEMKEWLDRESGVRIAVVPLLYEKGFESWFDAVIVVKASKKNIVSRLRESRGMSEEEIELRLRSQLPLREKVARADFIIDNDASPESAGEQVVAIWSKIREGAVAARRAGSLSRPQPGPVTIKEK